MTLTKIQHAVIQYPVLAFIACVGLVFIVGGVGSIATLPNIPNWYAGLEKPPLNPPNTIFGPVWSFLYVLIGTSLFLVLRTKASKLLLQPALYWFGIQLVLNLLWSLVFFGLQAPWLAFAVIVCLIAAIIMTYMSFEPISKRAAYLLLPYLAWVCFATYLNGSVAYLN